MKSNKKLKKAIKLLESILVEQRFDKYKNGYYKQAVLEHQEKENLAKCKMIGSWFRRRDSDDLFCLTNYNGNTHMMAHKKNKEGPLSFQIDARDHEKWANLVEVAYIPGIAKENESDA